MGIKIMEPKNGYSFQKVMNIIYSSMLVIVATTTILILVDFIRINLSHYKQNSGFTQCISEEPSGAGSCEKTVNVCYKEEAPKSITPATTHATPQKTTYQTTKKSKALKKYYPTQKAASSLQNKKNIDEVILELGENNKKYKEKSLYKSVFTKVYRFNQEEKYDYQVCKTCSRPLYFSRFGAVMANQTQNSESDIGDNYKSFISTTENNNISAIQDKILDIKILTREPQNTQIRWLVSFDGKATWKRWDGQNWVIADAMRDLKNIDFALVGNTSYEITKGLKNYSLKNGENSLDFAAEMFSLDSFSTPLISRIEIDYY